MMLRILTGTMILLLFAGSLLASGDSALEFERMMAELLQKRQQVGAQEFFLITEQSMTDFLEKYPDSPEAVEVHLNLGQLFSQAGSPDKAVSHLEIYLARSGERKPKEVAVAKFFLAQGYIARDEFDKAEVYLQEVRAAGDIASPKLRQMTEMMLKRIPILRKLKIGNPALPIDAMTTAGDRITLESYRGRVLLVDFWASWCKPCRQEMPTVKSVYREFHEKGFEILGISLDQSEASFRGYIEELGITWPQIFDGRGWKNSVGQQYGINSIPATFLLDRNGTIRYRDLRGDKLREAVRELIGAE
jgi:peroxiredoxin